MDGILHKNQWYCGAAYLERMNGIAAHTAKKGKTIKLLL